LDYFHRLDHLRQEIAAGRRAPIPVTPPANNGRDEANCILCFVLHVPLQSQTAFVVIAGLAMLAVRAVTPPRRLALVRVHNSIDCRGPPEF
jgi:hypothetical protein